VRAAGFGFGWHNHDFEFVPLADGSVPMQILLETAPDLDWEADIAWVIRGGADATDWIARHGKRITAVHVKDIAAAARPPTKTAGPMSAMAPWTGPACSGS
jgi:sugar phosphate isomerase/epimerase